jgi:hypothetical protein
MMQWLVITLIPMPYSQEGQVGEITLLYCLGLTMLRCYDTGGFAVLLQHPPSLCGPGPSL